MLWAEAVEAYEAGEDWYSVPTDEVAEEQTERQITIEQSEPWFQKLRMALTDPDSYKNLVFIPETLFVAGQQMDDVVIRAGQLHIILGLLLGIETSRQSQQDIVRLQRILRSIGFIKMRPSKGWFGGTYAYELRREQVPHLWPTILAAFKTSTVVWRNVEGSMKKPGE